MLLSWLNIWQKECHIWIVFPFLLYSCSRTIWWTWSTCDPHKCASQIFSLGLDCFIICETNTNALFKNANNVFFIHRYLATGDYRESVSESRQCQTVSRNHVGPLKSERCQYISQSSQRGLEKHSSVLWNLVGFFNCIRTLDCKHLHHRSNEIWKSVQQLQRPLLTPTTNSLQFSLVIVEKSVMVESTATPHLSEEWRRRHLMFLRISVCLVLRIWEDFPMWWLGILHSLSSPT